MTSKYGKSAVDATRRNTLPLFLDDALKTLEEGGGSSGGGGTTLSVTLNKDDWFSVSSPDKYLLDIPINLDTLGGSFMIFPEGSDSLSYAEADIKCTFNEESSMLTFSTMKKPTVDLRVVILMIGVNITSAEKVEF